VLKKEDVPKPSWAPEAPRRALPVTDEIDPV
jgi:hypothetical protein